MKYELLTPIRDPASTKEVPKRDRSTLEVRPVQTVADILHINREGRDAFERSLHLIARLTGLDYALEVSQLDMRDVNKLLDLINSLSDDPRDAKPDPKADTSAQPSG